MVEGSSDLAHEGAPAATLSESLPPPVRGRPRSTSISSGSPNPGPGVPLPTLFPDVAPAPPQLSHNATPNPFPFSFPSNSSTATASTSLVSNLSQQWSKSGAGTSTGAAGGGGSGHRSSLSVPGIVSPLPLVPDSVPPASPHQKPISLPPPFNAPTPLPPHLTGAPTSRSRSRSRSREREKEKARSRSRSGSREREEAAEDRGDRPRSPVAALGTAGMRLTGLEFVPKVHSPLASPPATEPNENTKMSDAEDDARRDESDGDEDQETPEPGSAAADDASSSVAGPPSLPPPVPPPSDDPAVTSALGLPLLSIPTATSPVGTPEHLEESPTSRSSYFALAPGAALARSPPPLPDHLASLPSIPVLERAPSWEDELDEDDFDYVDHDGTGEIGFSSAERRKSSGTKAEEERVSLLQALGLSKTQAERDEERELSERAAEKRLLEMETRERERLELMQEEERERQREFKSLGFMDIDLEAQGPPDEAEHELDPGFGEAGDLSVGDLGSDTITIDEESLSALERIFVCAKSEAVEERARVAHSLADWLPAVEICEAVEYVLPLLASLIEDEMVKEVFAPQLDRVMWHFFSHCPLAELDSASDKEASGSSSPVPSRYKPRSDSVVGESPAPSLAGPSDRSATPPPTSETSPAQSHSDSSSSNLPRISATTFTALLGALLTDQSTTVAKAAETSIVRFLCRLRDKPLPPVAPSDYASLEFPPPSSNVPQVPELAVSEPDPHSTYTFSIEARQVLEDEVVSGIVIGLARLDEEDPERSNTADHFDSAKHRPDEHERQDGHSENPVLFTSPEEQSFEFTEDEPDLEMRILMEWTQDRERKNLDTLAVDVPSSSSPPDQIFSSFSPEQPADEESSIGKMVSMSLIGAIAAADCLETSVLIKQFLPEVERMKTESMFYVRKEAVQALGNLATAVPVEELETNLLPLHAYFSKDQLWHVRRAAVLALPGVCKRLSRSALHAKAVEAIRHFSADENRNVRSGALEIAGELIYRFHGDPDGVPEELLSFFLGTPLDPSGDVSTTSAGDTSASSNPFSHFKSALESPSSSFLDATNSWSPSFFNRNTRDADRSILTAFNFPAVILTLGRDRWHLVRDHHQTLCKDPVEKARQSLASSLHEVAKVIGPDQADSSLVGPFTDFLQDVEIVQTAIIENIPTLLVSFGAETAKKALIVLSDSWSDIGNWRLREHVLKKVAEFGPHFMQHDGEEEVLTIVARAFKDSVASVREQAVVAVPPLLNSVLDRPASRAKLLAFLGVFRTDSSYRNRVAYVSTVGACVRASLPRDIFELYFLDTLVDLARDKVVSVRIAVARAISEACRCPALYAEPATRSSIRDVLAVLADSPDRDVRLPILDYYVSSPSPTRDPSPLSPLKTRQNLTSYGASVEDSPEISGLVDEDEDSCMDDDETARDGADERLDVDMGDFPPHVESKSDGVLLDRPEVVTRDDGDFVEVSRP
ncbi:hypothetical protein JCM11491_002658 [Sporobolomyces phaffii]